MATPTLKDVRAYCREKYGKDWWDIDKKIKNARKAEARRALMDETDQDEDIPLCQIVETKKKKPTTTKKRLKLKNLKKSE